MKKLIDVTGNRYSSLVVTGYSENTKAGKRRVTLICDCGKNTIATLGNLTSGLMISCGCIKAKKASERFTTHGLLKNNTAPKLYYIWRGMLSRCYNIKNKEYKNYGARGITVCIEWQEDYLNFFRDVGERPLNTTMDRIDNNGNYEPLNFRWATPKQQSNNKRTNIFLTYKDVTKTHSQWCEELNINYDAFKGRFRRGWSINDIMEKPYRERRKIV